MQHRICFIVDLFVGKKSFGTCKGIFRYLWQRNHQVARFIQRFTVFFKFGYSTMYLFRGDPTQLLANPFKNFDCHFLSG